MGNHENSWDIHGGLIRNTWAMQRQLQKQLQRQVAFAQTEAKTKHAKTK